MKVVKDGLCEIGLYWICLWCFSEVFESVTGCGKRSVFFWKEFTLDSIVSILLIKKRSSKVRNLEIFLIPTII